MKKTYCITGHAALLIVLLNLVPTVWCGGRAGRCFASAAQDADVQEERGGDPAGDHTLLAGEAGEASFLGQTYKIKERDRGHMASITLGGSFLLPEQGETPGLPIAALYLRHFWEGSRTRNIISIFVNELEYAKSFGNLELIGHFQNYTLPVDQKEVVNSEEIEPTSVRWGTLTGSLGPGLRFPVSPHQVDNDIRLQLLGRVGYLYAERTHDTGPTQVVPPNTLLYGVRLRARYDGMRRNLLELPHQGFAAGWDLDYMHRDNWRDLEPVPSGSNHRNYFQASGHLVGAGGIPGLSERDRVLISLYGGKTNGNSADRFNAFLINGGPFPSEQEDLARVHYTGIIYDDVRATSYATASLGYRRELAFFLYLSAVGSYLWADRATVRGLDQVVFRDQSAAAVTASLDSGFFWNSALYLAYTWESEFIRGGKSGSGVILTWNKLF
ncbi:MAG: porin [Geobacteraceae bacterium GWC2_58_44]|nr:MAG: porin [Geobacteraceae bacterium GWC2_58_44]HBG05793.1 porin [Geobacter sp.]